MKSNANDGKKHFEATEKSNKNINNMFIRLETPTQLTSDYSIENMNIKLKVKDHKSNVIEELTGEWPSE